MIITDRDFQLFCAGWRLLYDRKTNEYLWLGLHNSLNFTGKESDEEQLFLQVPVPVFRSPSRSRFP